MTAFFRVWHFTRNTGLIGNLLTVSLAGSEWGLPNRAAHCQGLLVCDRRTAELPEGFGLKPLSTRIEARLCIYQNAVGIEPTTYCLSGSRSNHLNQA